MRCGARSLAWVGVAANGLGVFDLIQEERFKRCGAQEQVLVGELAFVMRLDLVAGSR